MCDLAAVGFVGKAGFLTFDSDTCLLADWGGVDG